MQDKNINTNTNVAHEKMMNSKQHAIGKQRVDLSQYYYKFIIMQRSSYPIILLQLFNVVQPSLGRSKTIAKSLNHAEYTIRDIRDQSIPLLHLLFSHTFTVPDLRTQNFNVKSTQSY